jgi:flagellar hook-length control protein FliK
MDIGTIVSNVPTVSTAGTGAAVNAKGTGQETGGSEFANALQGKLAEGDIIKVDPNQLPTEEILAAILQILPQIVQNPVTDQSEAESTITSVLQALNNDPAFADSFMKDPNVKQWLSEAAGMLKALGTQQVTSRNNQLQTLIADSSQGGQLQAQKVLLSFVSLLQEQPNNPVLKDMFQQFQTLVAPLMNERAIPAENAVLLNSSSVKSDTAKTVEAKKVPAHSKSTSETQPASLPNTDQAVNVSTVQSVKSKLEFLSAKASSLSYRVSELNANGSDEVKLALSPIAEQTDSTLPNQQLMDVFKTIAANDNALKGQSTFISAHNFAEEMSSHMLNTMKITLASNGLSEAKLNLFPENLGHVSVKIAVHQGQMIAQFAADTAAGKQMLEAQLPQLRQMLQNQGLQVEKLEVTQQQAMQSSMFQDQRNGQAFQQFTGQNQGQFASSSQSYADDTNFFEELAETVQTRRTGTGNAFEASA